MTVSNIPHYASRFIIYLSVLESLLIKYTETKTDFLQRKKNKFLQRKMCLFGEKMVGK